MGYPKPGLKDYMRLAINLVKWRIWRPQPNVVEGGDQVSALRTWLGVQNWFILDQWAGDIHSQGWIVALSPTGLKWRFFFGQNGQIVRSEMVDAQAIVSGKLVTVTDQP